MPNQSVTQLVTGEGGMLAVRASSEGYTDTVTTYVTGSQIANADITRVTTGMYTTENGGQPATQNLFTLIAFTESTCRQFTRNADTRYPSAFWPTENTETPPPLGAQIGLMMDAIRNLYAGQTETAWNWLTNTTVSLDLFNEKLSADALAIQTTAISGHTGLPAFSQYQLENMALGEYGTRANSVASKQYYVPKCVGGRPSGKTCKGGQWQWVKNRANAVTKYADGVRAAPNPPCP